MEGKPTFSDFLNPADPEFINNSLGMLLPEELVKLSGEFKKLENKYLALFLIFLEKKAKPDAVFSTKSHNQGKSYLEKHLYFQELKEKCGAEFIRRRSTETAI
jgi:hypothetical protein